MARNGREASGPAKTGRPEEAAELVLAREPMRICFYGNQLGFVFGNYRHLLNLAKWFQEQGHEVVVLTKGRELRTRTIEGVRYESLSLERRKSLGSFYFEFPVRSLLHFLTHREFDIIHSTAGYNLFAILARLVGVVSGTPTIYEAVSPASGTLRFLRFAKLICASRNVKRGLGQDAVFIPHCVDLKSFDTSAEYGYRRGSSFVVGTMGSAVPRRGFNYLIKAIPLVLKKHPDVRFVLAIDHPQTEYIPEMKRYVMELEELVRSIQAPANVQIVSGELDVPTFFNSLDVFVYAIQTTEGMVDLPPTVLECMAAGCALISTPKGGIPEAARNYENAILVDEDHCADPRAYADKINELIENRDLLSRIRASARESAEAYDVEEIAPQVMRVYQEVLSRKA
jgi:glycosyltransferase involved in cell wall biosynthesis